MSKAQELIINESENELKALLRKQLNIKGEKRIVFLLRLSSNEYITRAALAEELRIDKRTLERWITKYREGGLKKLFSDSKRNKGSKIFTPEIHKGLEQKVNGTDNPLWGYKDAQVWVKQEFDLDVKYNTIRRYLMTKFKTKLKSPRKSHIKKDELAVSAFLKPS